VRELASPMVRMSDSPRYTIHDDEAYFVQGIVKVRKYGMSAERSKLDSRKIA